MSDSSSVSSAASVTAEPTLADLLKQAREHQKAASDLLKQVSVAAKGMKAPRKKGADVEKKPRKTSDGQRRWQHFQRFVWEQLQEENATAPFKEAMSVAGTRWDKGCPITAEDQVAFDAYCEEHPVPTAEEAAAAKMAKDAALAEEKAVKKAEREMEKTAKTAAKTAAKADAAPKAAKATPAAAAKAAVAAAAPKPIAKPSAGAGGGASASAAKAAPAPKAATAPKAASKVLADGEHEIDGKKCLVMSGHVFDVETGSPLGVINAKTGKLDKTAAALKACETFEAANADNDQLASSDDE
jgi:hypothetical protein